MLYLIINKAELYFGHLVDMRLVGEKENRWPTENALLTYYVIFCHYLLTDMSFQLI